jgi:beta-lactam-binding protein with PASTA domain
VVGQKLAKAKSRIARAHCRVGKITRKHSSARKKGKVIGQSPRAGRRLANGAKVNLVVGKG